MTRKDYTVIANAIAAARKQYGAGHGTAADGIGTAMVQISLALESANPNFRRSAFIATAGGEEAPPITDPHDHYVIEEGGWLTPVTDEMDEALYGQGYRPGTAGRYNFGSKEAALVYACSTLKHMGLDPTKTVKETEHYRIILWEDTAHRLEPKTDEMRTMLELRHHRSAFANGHLVAGYERDVQAWADLAMERMTTPEKWDNEHYRIASDGEYFCIYPKTDEVADALRSQGYSIVGTGETRRLQFGSTTTAARIAEAVDMQMQMRSGPIETEHYRIEKLGDGRYFIVSLSDEFEDAMQREHYFAHAPRIYDFGTRLSNALEGVQLANRHMREPAL
jgi:hypothetical protein